MSDKEYIEREAARKFLAQDYAYAAAELLKYVPAADVVEVRRGEWIDNHNGTFTCTVCGGKCSKMDWCGRCGADMRGNNNDNRTEN